MQRDHEEDRLLTIREACETLSLRERTLRAWIAAGRMPAVRLSRRAIRVRLSDLHAFIEGRRTGAEAVRGR